MLERLNLRLRVFLIFAALAGGSLAALGLGLAVGYRRLGSAEMLPALLQGAVIAAFAIFGLTALIWYLFDLNVAKPIEGLAGSLRARAHADVDRDIETAPARYLGDLAPAASAAAATLAETRNALAEAVARETARLTTEKALLEALLSDVPVGVLLCSAEHQLVFYNGQAVDLLRSGGLDRPLFDYLREGPIRHAYERLRETDDPDAASDVLCSSVGGERVLAARMRLLGTGGKGPGYVLTLRDVTADLVTSSHREALLSEVFDRVKRPAANLQTVVGVRSETVRGQDPLDDAIRTEVDALGRALAELSSRYEEGRAESWPMTMTRASDLLDGLRARMESRGLTAGIEAGPLLLRCNAFEVIVLMAGLAETIAAAAGVSQFGLSVEEDGPGAMLRLTWTGQPLSVGQMERRLNAPLDDDIPGMTGRRVLETHATELWPERGPGDRASLCFPILRARRAGRRPLPIARTVVYDFDLLSKSRNALVMDSPLDDLTYVVFDTETTGLLPAQGDEIVQIAAVRIVNGRRVEGEVFDTLVNPRRSIPPSSTEVHGITDAMVQEAPDIDDVCRRFHKFATGAVLIAHNAPFDMEFLRRREEAIGLRFENPILDTVLLSAVVFGQMETHSLDALTHRLGITIPEEARHTAIGDTVATADAFLKLLPMLRARELVTFGEVLSEVRRHGRLLKDLNSG
jgi:DNA polymerase-3 subunit epsilon